MVALRADKIWANHTRRCHGRFRKLPAISAKASVASTKRGELLLPEIARNATELDDWSKLS